MPMGLKNVPSFFRRIMAIVLYTAHPDLPAFISVYIDDIIIATEGEGLTAEELTALHEKQLNQMMDILDSNEVICGPEKGKIVLNPSNLVVLFSRKVPFNPVQGSSSLLRSGSALRPLQK